MGIIGHFTFLIKVSFEILIIYGSGEEDLEVEEEAV